MAGMAVDGLVSGLSTTDLINQLMQIESQPQAALKTKVTSTNSFITALQGLNTKIASLTTAATAAAKPETWDLFKVAASSDAATATAGTGASASTLDFRVDSVSKAQTSVSEKFTNLSDLFAGNPPKLSITKKDGTQVDITALDGSNVEILGAINRSAAGVKASLVSVGGGEYRLQLTSTTTGEAGGFTVGTGDPAALTPVALTETTKAADAKITLYAGTAAEQQIRSSTNTFDGVAPGVTITVAKTSTDPVTLTISPDNDAAKTKAKGLFDSLAAVFSEISTKSAVTNTTDSSGKSKVAGGLFTGDSAIRDISQRLLSAASLPVDGKSPSEIGITVARDGSISFDADKFAKALASDPDKAGKLIEGIAGRIAEAGKQVSDPRDGVLSLKVQGQQSVLRDLNNSIDDWDTRLAVRRSGLERQYSALEVALSNMQSQSQWLAGQLSSLSAQTSS